MALLAPGSAAARIFGPDALWRIVHEQCVPDQQRHGDPAPCALVDLSHGVARGYAVLKDIRGATQYLLIPTTRLGGIESAAVRAPNAPNHFAAAWRARTFIDEHLPQPLSRDAVVLAINSRFARSQDQLHIHIDCIRADVRAALAAHAAAIGPRWARFAVPLAGRRYRAMRVMGETLGAANPFALLAAGVPGAKAAMGSHTLAVAGAVFAGGRPGFILLDDEANLPAGDRAGSEALQDHTCAVARRG